MRCLQVIDDEAKAENVHISMGFAGQQAPNFGMNNIVLFMRGSDDGELRVQLIEGSGLKLDQFREKLRKALPDRVVPWLEGVLRGYGYSEADAKRRAQQMKFGFEPGDIVSKTMSFGSPTPIEVMAVSHNLEDARITAKAIETEIKKIKYLRDVQIQQTLDYPSVPIRIDREKAGLSGVTAQDVSDSILVATSSSRLVERNYWQDPNSGISYQVQIEVPTARMDSVAQAEAIPLKKAGSD